MHAGHSAAPVPHASWYPCTGPPCFPLTLRVHTPCRRSYHLAPLLDGFLLLFSSIYIFNSNRRTTMAATTSPPKPQPSPRRRRNDLVTAPTVAATATATSTVATPTTAATPVAATTPTMAA